jgi:hypothetical protein
MPCIDRGSNRRHSRWLIALRCWALLGMHEASTNDRVALDNEAFEHESLLRVHEERSADCHLPGLPHVMDSPEASPRIPSPAAIAET